MTRWIAAGVLVIGLVGAAVAQEPVCDPSADKTVPVFEEAKSAMLTGDYDRFYRQVTPYVANPDEKRASLIGPLQRLMPNGFEGCATIVHRFEPPGLYQEVVFFDTGKGPLGLYLSAAMFDGELRIIFFSYSDSPADMLENLN